VAAGADKSGANMHLMWKINMVRHSVDPHPRDRLAFFPVLFQLFDFRGIPGDELMAGAAVRHGRNAGNMRFRGLAMTEEARDSVVPGMHLMAEGDRLGWRAVPKIQRQIVHECEAGQGGKDDDSQPADKPQ